MKSFMVVVLLAVAVCAVNAVPVDDFADLEMSVDDVDAAYGGDELQGVRQRRVTCDLLSFGGKVGHSACAANCLSMGKAGGRCNDGVCQCRKTSIGDLWNKRFG